MLHGAENTGRKSIDSEQNKLLNNCFRVFKKSPARRTDRLQSKDLHDLREGRTRDKLFPRILCGHCWLENSKCFTIIIEIYSKLLNYRDSEKPLWRLQVQMKFLRHDERLIHSNSKLSWIKLNWSYATLFIDHDKWHWIITDFFSNKKTFIRFW